MATGSATVWSLPAGPWPRPTPSAAVTVSKLGELHFAGISRIEPVHAGFEPAVLGFYRGLLTWLASSGAHLIVQPLYLIGRLTPGTPWGGYRGVGR